MADLLPPPTDLGAPSKFPAWRKYQQEAILRAMESKARFLAQVQPTGSGKSLCYVMASVLCGERTLILTSTKALQDQIMQDFGVAFGLADVRGQVSYLCLHNENVNCDDGACHVGYECGLKNAGCLYYDAVRRARAAKIVVTNYAFWLTSAKYGDQIGKFDMLVLDEAHDAPEWVMKAVSAAVSEQITKDIADCKLPEGNEAGRWKEWAAGAMVKVQEEIKQVGKLISTGHAVGIMAKAGRLRAYERALGNILWNDPANIVVDRESVNGYVMIEPISAVGLAEKLLFRGIERVLLTSATIRPKTLFMMGVNNGGYEMDEYSSQFDPKRRPVIYVPTVRVQHDMTRDAERKWVAQIDNVLRQRQDRKGIIHTVSYARAKKIVGESEFRDHMILHDKWSLNKSIRAFRDADPPMVLVSPSVVTGYDFPMTDAEYQIIAKVAFPDSRTLAIKARTKRDPEYSYYITMQQVVQAAGRGMRSEKDQCEVFVVDDNWVWFIGRYRKFAPKWFLESCVTSRVIPKPPERIGHV